FKIFNYLYSRRISESEDLADKIKREIEFKITEEFNLDKLSKEINYSKNHIINIFSSKFGMTPYQYYKKSKIALAKEYLINSKMTVGEISNTLAYTDQQYFSYSFKKETGYSPKKYREIMKV
ncbi:MAG: AraC family transcriptional regulator, partial [Clostridia bacterium]|nr:AraC family transcriptional regulator [Clostridia bacterium]